MDGLSEIGKLAVDLRSALARAERETGNKRLNAVKEGLDSVEKIKVATRGQKDREGEANLKKFEHRLRELLPKAVRETVAQLIAVARAPTTKPEIRSKATIAIRTLLKEHRLSVSDFGITESSLLAWQTPA